MMLLVTFDLPRQTPQDRKQANEFRKRLIRLGFTMKQFSLYEREVRSTKTTIKVIEILKKQLPKSGSITLYQLPNEVNNNQITILGSGEIQRVQQSPRLIIL